MTAAVGACVLHAMARPPLPLRRSVVDGIAVSDDQPDPRIIAKFSEDEGLADGAVPVASLSVLWYLEPDGRDGVTSKFDGHQRVSVTVGDLMSIIHTYLQADDEEQ